LIFGLSLDVVAAEREREEIECCLLGESRLCRRRTSHSLLPR